MPNPLEHIAITGCVFDLGSELATNSLMHEAIWNDDVFVVVLGGQEVDLGKAGKQRPQQGLVKVSVRTVARYSYGCLKVKCSNDLL